MNKNIFLKNVILLMVLSLVVLFLFSTNKLFARSSSEIAEEIRQQQESLRKLQEELKNAENNLSNYKNLIEGTVASIPELEEEINRLEAEIQRNNIQLKFYEESKKLKDLEKLKNELIQQQSIKEVYKDWRIKDKKYQYFLDFELDFKRSRQYGATILSDQQDKILGLSIEVLKLSGEIDYYENTISSLNDLNKDLEAKKQSLVDQIAYLNSLLAYTGGRINSYQENIQKIQSSISFLGEEQRLALIRESEITSGEVPSISGCFAQDTTNSGDFFFCGLGRDRYQGHGVGLSQWGSHGMALKGFSYDQIINFYFTSVNIVGGYENTVINVHGTGNINIEDYVAGQGEIARKACGTPEQVASRPDKYVIDNPNTVWDCWPEESIKAFAIVFRTYAINYVNRMGSICNSPACQVYEGGNATKWAADETRGQVILHAGVPIEALYSSDNNQGFGTANNDTIWHNYAGDAWVSPYLRSVNDNPFATYTSWTNFGYRTQNYTIGELNNMLNFVSQNPGIFGGISSHVENIRNTIGGEVKTLTFERDPSKRVKKVWLTGANGQSGAIGGYWFKYIWNVWADLNNKDFLYSQTFFMHPI